MALKKLCSYGSCHKVIDSDNKYCDKHQEQFEKREKERYKEYKIRRQAKKEIKKQQDFYNSGGWKRLRKEAIAKHYAIDIYEYYTTGRIVSGERVHHIIEVQEDWNSRLDILNLIYLTEQNHRHIHVKYDSGKRHKEKMQKTLLDMITRFEKEFR